MIKFLMVIVSIVVLFLMFNLFIRWYKGEHDVFYLLKPLGVSSILLLVLFFIGVNSNEKVEVTKNEIYSLGLNKNAITAQSFFLGTSGTNYLYYTGDSISGFNLESIPAMKTTIKYTDEKPFVIVNKITTSLLFSTFTEIDKVELYIPHGSIIEDYKVDL